MEKKKNLWNKLFDGVDTVLNPLCDTLEKVENALDKEINKDPNK